MCGCRATAWSSSTTTRRSIGRRRHGAAGAAMRRTGALTQGIASGGSASVPRRLRHPPARGVLRRFRRADHRRAEGEHPGARARRGRGGAARPTPSSASVSARSGGGSCVRCGRRSRSSRPARHARKSGWRCTGRGADGPVAPPEYDGFQVPETAGPARASSRRGSLPMRTAPASAFRSGRSTP